MDGITVVALVVVFLVLVGWGATGWLDKRPRAAPQEPKPRRSLPTVQAKCSECAHWDLAHGQTLMAKHRPFALAASHVSPSQMGVPMRAFKPNAEYERVRAELDAALDEGAPDAQLRELQAQLEVLNPQVVDEDAVNVDPRVETLRWEDFGACLHLRELRAGNDRCEAFASKHAHPDLADDLEPEVHA